MYLIGLWLVLAGVFAVLHAIDSSLPGGRWALAMPFKIIGVIGMLFLIAADFIEGVEE